jgi:hypothetical protein
VLAAGLIVIALWGTPCEARVYQNLDFGFAFEIPKGFPTCETVPPSIDPGDTTYHDPHDSAAVWLDDGPDGCAVLKGRPVMEVHASYNALSWPTPEVVVDKLCEPIERHAWVPKGLSIKGKHVVACRYDSDDRWIEITLVAQGGKRPAAEHDATPLVNYMVTLGTRPERLAGDLARFRAFLRTVRLFQPAD